ncbi:MAG TPA: hypothetical protein VKU86_11090 [Acidimicrobiales bacterium]|nr:hypothetical protein [Acidimicrobiales bacterium]
MAATAPWRGLVAAWVVACLATACSPGASSGTPVSPTAVTVAALAPSGRPYTCAPGADGTVYGSYGDASAIGWPGNQQGVVACLGGSFYVQSGAGTTYGYGVYDDTRTTWSNLDGYLPALVTSFRRSGCDVSITNFADDVTVGGHDFVTIYSRVAVHNPSAVARRVDPEPSGGLLPLATATSNVPPHATVDHDYVVAADRFGQSYPWPTPSTLEAAGGFDAHLAHMRSFWDSRLSTVAQVQLPDHRLEDAYRSGYIYTQIARSAGHLDTGVNGYEMEFSHDVIGILANLFTQGDYTDAHALLLDARSVVGSQFQYEDGIWTYAWPWAIYLLKTGDVAFVASNFSTEGSAGTGTPSIEDTAHQIAADRTGPNGIMRRTDDIDSNGYWTVDDEEALMGLAAYRYLADRIGNAAEAAWASQQYDSLLAATNAVLDTTISRYHLNYLPCSMVTPNTDNRCRNPEDANWAAPMLFGRWAWDAPLFGAAVSGPAVDLVDATYAYGFGRAARELPAGTFGGYPDDYYSSAYNAGYGSGGLAGSSHRDQAITSYQFMIDHTQSGPYAWWESSSAPSRASPWAGDHPRAGQGSSPHAWGIANANKALLDSLVAQRADGSVLVGRGVPDTWVRDGQNVTVSNFPTANAGRTGLAISTHGLEVTLTVSGDAPPGPVLFELPAFVDNLGSATAGTVDASAGAVTLPAAVGSYTVTMLHGV